MTSNSMASHDLLPNYRLETPSHLQYMLIAGLGSGLVGFILLALLPESNRVLSVALLLIGGTALVMTILLALVTNDRVRHSARQVMMQAIDWRGDETVLDVGCGNGFLLIEAAKHLKTGKAIGIDIWVDGSGGQNEVSAQRNARIEGVSDKIEVQNVDARTMLFPDASFDVIFASLSLHHAGNRADRALVIKEMKRVLKPGGIILLYDMFSMINGAKYDLRHLGITRIQRLSGYILQILKAEKTA